MLRTATLTFAFALVCAAPLAASAQTGPDLFAEAEADAAAIPEKPPVATLDELDPLQPVSEAVTDLAGWVIASGDNRGLPFAVVDKQAAQVLVFGADGKIKGIAPALIGSAVGDGSAPGVGDRELKDIPLDDRTTPAGRYFAAFGPAAGGKKALWVDYATAIAIHPMESTAASRRETRKQRLASRAPDDNRITHGCINVSPAFFAKIVRPAFQEAGGVFYVLPDTATVQDAFPAFEPLARLDLTREAPKPKPKPARKPAKKRVVAAAGQ